MGGISEHFQVTQGAGDSARPLDKNSVKSSVLVSMPS